MQRLRPLDLGSSAEARPTLEHLLHERGWLPRVYRTLAHSPTLLDHFVAFTTGLRSGTTLPARDRELAILAVARELRVEIAWLAHLPLARDAGLPTETIEALAAGADIANARDAAITAFAREVTSDAQPSKSTWDALRARLDERQLVELTLTVAFYNMVARFLLTAGVETDPEYLVGTDRSQTRSSPA